MPDLLLEIGTEEIPAGFLPGTITQLEKKSSALFADHRLEAGEIKAYATPRRLVLAVRDLADRQPDRTEEKTGPPLRVAYDGDGNPTKAALGFAKTNGVPVDQLIKLETSKGEYLGVRLEKKGEETKIILNALLPELVKKIHFPKTMRWGNSDFRFARPIHWILAILGEETLDLEIAGIKSGNFSYGHRFLAPDKFEVSGIDDYFEKTKQHKVIVDHEARRKIIEEKLEKTKEKLFPGENTDFTNIFNVLNEVMFLVEWPVIVVGQFEEDFLKLPADVIRTSAEKNQKYFMIYEEKEGLSTPLKNRFIAVSNMPDEDGLIAQGNERVLRARLNDAQFFFDEDKKKWPDSFIDDLKGIIFQQKLGTVYQKCERNYQLVKCIDKTTKFKRTVFVGSRDTNGEWCKLEKIAFLCKADLATQMVGEFPDLQGEMGFQYTLEAGEDINDVCNPIREHYWPRKQEDWFPFTPVGILLSLSDKIDTICGCFSIGQKPSGSKDPFALRRQALGIIRIAIVQLDEFNLVDAINKSISLYSECNNAEKVASEVFDFFKERIKQLKLADGLRYDLVEAALESNWNDICDVEKRIHALVEVSKQESFNDLMITFKRASRILPKERLAESQISKSLLNEPEERQLYECYLEISKTVEPLLAGQEYQAALDEMVKLKPFLDTFFDEVMVMTKNDKIRKNRLSLLANITKLFGQVAEVSRIVI